MRIPSMQPVSESADEGESHALHGLLADLNITPPSNGPHVQLPTWSFPASTSARNTPSPGPADDSIFSPRPPPRYHPNSAPELDFTSPTHVSNPTLVAPPPPAINQPSLFNTPNRSIFSSGPPTSSVSANTAQASMSSPSPVHPTHPLSALTVPASGPTRRSVHYQNESLPTTIKNRIPRAEKDVDDPSVQVEGTTSAERRGTSTPTALTRLFSAPEVTPIVSRHSSYIRTASGTAYTRASSAETAPLPNHLYNRGLLAGRHSDIAVHAFGTRYALHRLLLDRAPFFSSALSEPWFESSSKEIALHPEDIDSNITQAAFELALKRLYGCNVAAEEDKEAVGLFATGCWLEMADLVDSSVTSILRQMSPAKIGPLIKLVTNNYYGKNGDRILATAKAMLCREGWEMPLRYWDGVSGEIAREIIGGDGFFVSGEWERWVLAKRVLDRKLKLRAIDAGLIEPNGKHKRAAPDTMSFSAIRFDTVYRKNSAFANRHIPEAYDSWLALYTNPDIAALLVLLDEGIHYIHLSFEQLQKIRSQRDILGLPLMPEKVINDALWTQMELRQKIVNAPELEEVLGLSKESEETQEAHLLEEPSEAINGKGKERDTDIYDDHEDDDEMESGSWDGNGKPRKFWIPNVDSTSVTGASPDTSLYATPSTNRPYISRLSASIDPVDVQWASDFTASANERPTTADRNEPIPPISYTNYPPFRFAAEFPNPRNLKEKKRVYSRTVWYAGSLWNVYIQKVETTKNTQLGVYLHRAKEKEGSEDSHHRHTSSVDERIGQVEMLMRRNRNRRRSRGESLDEEASNSGTDPDSTLVAPGQLPSRAATISNLLRGGGSRDDSSVTKSSQTPTPFTLSLPYNSTPNLIDSDDNDEAAGNRESCNTNHSVPTIPTYIDGRSTIKTYFKIYSPSKGGRMLSVYESAPDSFNFSQSWGWKSSTMVLDDALCGYDGGGDSGGNGKGGRDGRLRFMVVIGML